MLKHILQLEISLYDTLALVISTTDWDKYNNHSKLFFLEFQHLSEH